MQVIRFNCIFSVLCVFMTLHTKYVITDIEWDSLAKILLLTCV